MKGELYTFPSEWSTLGQHHVGNEIYGQLQWAGKRGEGSVMGENRVSQFRRQGKFQ